MITLGLDFVTIKDHRGFESGFFWSDVQQIIGVHEHGEWVSVKFRCDPAGYYALKMKISVQEFLEQVKERLNPSDENTFPEQIETS